MLAWYASVSASEKRPTAASAASCSHQALPQTHDDEQRCHCIYERHNQHSQELHHRIHVRKKRRPAVHRAGRKTCGASDAGNAGACSQATTHTPQSTNATHVAPSQPCVSSEHASAGAVHAAARLLTATLSNLPHTLQTILKRGWAETDGAEVETGGPPEA